MILASFFKALSQLPDPRFRSVLWRGIGLTIALLVAIYALLLMLIEWLTADPIVMPGVGEVTWLGDLLGWGSLGLVLVMSIFLMVPVASAITSLFLDEVAQAVEDKHFTGLPEVPRISFWDGLRDTVNFLGVLIAANIFALILYVIFPFAAIFIFYALNGYLLGREYFQLAAMRRIGRVKAKALRKQHSATIWLAGCLMAVPLTFPLINLVIPILGAATFTHLYHAVSRD
ncbi:EI24 domain-containing protein [Yoonia sp. F2084L]|uniref:EI24 domain-containing protein n=1 Tax=Yoonia sp. F2084L TaxID=2926419 RepID=UPI001FF5B981|nr:EI24 domain-containing protein [Yoonia sp. F2084L]MCK0095480.1 EI24 domain-containing protein [Yoonia sp. F2084L]